MKRLLLGLMVLAVFSAPNAAKAAAYSDNFDDGLMNSTLWTYVVEGNPANTNLYEGSGLLNFTAIGSGEFSSKHYISNWTLDLSNDFAIRTDFNYPYSATSGAVELGLFRGESLWGDSFFAAIEASSDARDGGHLFQMEIGGISPYYQHSENRSITSGWLGIRYNSLADLLEFGAFDPQNNQIASGSYSNFKNLGVGPLGVFIGGYSDGAVLTAGQANLDNFQAAVTPEPISCALFLVGGGALALVRRKKITGKRV